MNTIFGSVLAAWSSPAHASIAVLIFSAFGYWLYHWVQHEPKALPTEQEPNGPGAQWWRGL